MDLDIETFIHGDMFHVDGIVFDNQVKLCWPSKYSAPCANFKTTNYLASYSLHKSNPLTRKLQVYSDEAFSKLAVFMGRNTWFLFLVH